MRTLSIKSYTQKHIKHKYTNEMYENDDLKTCGCENEVDFISMNENECSMLFLFLVPCWMVFGFIYHVSGARYTQ